MTYTVEIRVNATIVVPDIFDWINDQGLQHIVDWRWFRLADPNMLSFQFDREENATMFALKWL